MVVYCFVEGCKSTKYKSKREEEKLPISFYGFPSDKNLKEKWINALFALNNQKNVKNLPKYSRICIKHFASDQIEQFGMMRVRLKKNAIPTIFPKAVQKCEELHNEEAKPVHLEHSEMLKSHVESQINPQSTKEFNGIDKIKCNRLFSQEHELVQKMMTCKETDSSTSNMEIKVENNMERINKKSNRTSQIRYPGDIYSLSLDNKSSDEIAKIITIFKKSCKKKDKTIKRLQTQNYRQKKKIQNMKQMFEKLRKEYNLSSNCCKIFQVNKN